MVEQSVEGWARTKGVPMEENSSGDAGPADTEHVSDDEGAGPPASHAEGLPAEVRPPDGAAEVSAAAALHPLDVDERMAKLFERVQGSPDPVQSEAEAGHEDGVGVGPGSATASDPAPARSRYAFGASPPPPYAGAPIVWPPPPAPSSRRRVWPVVTAVAVVVLLAGVGIGMYAVSKSGPDTGTALTSAVTTTEQSKTADVALSMSIGAGGPSITIAGNGASDFATNATNLTLSFSAGGQQIAERSVIDGATAYYNIGPLVGEIVPGKSWVSMDIGSSASGSGSFGTGGIFSDPSTLLAVIGAPGTALHSLGPSGVGAARVQQYSVDLGPAGIKKALSSETLPSSLRAEMSAVHYTEMDYVVAVDGTNHLTQVRTTGAYSVAGEHFTVASTMDMSDYGTSVTVAPPPASAVVSYQRFETIAGQDRGNATT
jgi:hypothetical protein